MIVTLDGRRVDESFAHDSTLQTLIDQIKAGHLNDRLVVSVAVDGRRLGDADLDARLELTVANNAQVDLESADSATLVGDVLQGLARHFEQAGAQLPGIADRLNSGDLAAAMRDVAGFITLWQTCYRGLAQCSGLLNEDLTAREHDGRTVQAHLEELIEKLTALRGALESRDVVLLADLVRYELPPLSWAWRALLINLAEQLAAVVPDPA